MKKNKIMSIGLFAILSLSIIPMLFQNNVYAQLQPVKIDGLGVNIMEVHYQESTGILWALGGSRSTENVASLLEINPANNTLLNTYNMTNALNDGAPIDIWCGETSCFITSRGTTTDANKGAIARIETIGEDKGDISGMLNATNTSRGFGRIDGRDSTATGIGGIGLFTETWNASDNKAFITAGGIGTIQITSTLNTFVDGPLSSTTGISTDIRWSGISANTTNNLLFTDSWSSTTTKAVRIFNLSDSTTVCNEGITISSNTHGGQIIMDIDNRLIYVADGSDGNYDSMNIDTCAVTANAITDSDTGLSGALIQKNGIAVQERDLMFFQQSGASATVSSSGYDFDTETFSGELTTVEIGNTAGQNALFGRAYYAVEHDNNGQITTGAVIGSGATAFNAIFIPIGGSDQAIFVFKFEAPSEPEEVTGINCELPANQNILICRLTETTGGNIGGLGGIIDTGLFTLFTNSGIIDGSDTDPQTNGIGYFITIAGFGVMTAMFFIATKGRLNEVPTFIWMLSAIALLGAITAIGWLDPTFLIIGIIAIVALASMQVRNTISSGLDFGGRGDF